MSLFYRHFGMASAKMFSEQHPAGNMRKCSLGGHVWLLVFVFILFLIPELITRARDWVTESNEQNKTGTSARNFSKAVSLVLVSLQGSFENCCSLRQQCPQHLDFAEICLVKINQTKSNPNTDGTNCFTVT